MKYKLFGNSGLRVSELCLGTMTFGTEWGTGADKEESKKIFDAFVNVGGNFLDTANRYTEGTSEKMVGEFMGAERDSFVLATKYTLYNNRKDPNASGNHRKNMIKSVEGSLKRLNTDYIDLLWLHAWDSTTPIEEVMRAMDDLIRSGKVHYIGISDTPAWIVSKANTLAELRGWTQFIGLQVEYSLVQRTPERDLLPMAKHFGMSITPWSPLGGGILTGKYNDGIDKEGRLTENSRKVSEGNRIIAKKLTEIAQKIGHTPPQVALNWLRQQDSKLIPIMGGRKVAQIEDCLGCLNFQIANEFVEELNQISQIDLGFPHDFLSLDAIKDVMFGDNAKNIVF
jgi:aryl-alcohol dehydrogenase-like predicted oxidoreductase